MKTKVSYLIAIFAGLAIATYSQDVEKNIVEKVANSFIASRIDKSENQNQNTFLEISFIESYKQNDTSLYYLFRILPEDGFIIVSTERDYEPILAYSFNRGYCANDSPPPAFLEWMDEICKEILFVKRNNEYVNPKARKRWEELICGSNFSDNILSVGPLLTTTWNQGCYYNDSCPSDPSGPCQHALTGCVPTAMAQIMKYHDYPVNGQGLNCYNTSNYGLLCADFTAATYDWSHMPNSLNSYSTNQEVSAVAQLMYHCGNSCYASYSAGNTGSHAFNVFGALPLNFNYDPNIKTLERDDVTTNEWVDTLKTELDASRPIYYGAWTSSVGHAFVCDGYQDGNYFHFNWGWGGTYNGFFHIDNLNPGPYNFAYGHEIVYNIQPDTNTLENYVTQNVPFEILILGDASFCDFNNDGDLDLLYCGIDNNLLPKTKLYANSGNNFSNITHSITNVCMGSISWGDYNNDGYIDLAINGFTEFPYINPVSKIYKNNNGSGFIDINANLVSLGNGSISWCDMDNDGDLDLLVSGGTNGLSFSGSTKIYENIGNDSFVEKSVSIIQVIKSSIDWGDYDNDNDMDLLITGFENNLAKSKIYKNNGNFSFVDLNSNLANVGDGAAKWFDYDNDNDLDVILSGCLNDDQDTAHTGVYQNNNGVFSEITQNFIDIGMGSTLDIGDFDNDGDQDILQSGIKVYDPSWYVSSFRICINKGNGTFNQHELIGEGIYSGTAIWGDYDNDLDLDIFVSGGRFVNSGSGNITTLLKNEVTTQNTTPNPPNGLESSINNDIIQFTWNKSSDTQTPQNLLSYNLTIGEDSSTCNIISPMSDLNSGYRRVVRRGNTCQDTCWKIGDLGFGIYYWSVQAIDGAHIGSEFSSFEQLIFSPTSTFSIDDTACVNEVVTVTYTGTASDTANYFWDFDGAVINSGSGAGPYNVHWTTTGNKEVELYVIENGASSDTTISNIYITDIPITPNSPTGPTELCQDGPNTTYTTYQVPNATSYNWSLVPWEAGGIIPSDTSCLIDWTTDYSGECYLSVQSWNSCGTSTFSDSLEITLNPKPNFDITAYPNDTALISETITLSTDISNCTYLWSNGETTQTIYVINQSGPNGGQDDYWLQVTNNYNCQDIEYISVWFLLPISISLEHQTDFLRIFPNPNDGKFILRNRTLENIKLIKLYNDFGQEVSIKVKQLDNVKSYQVEIPTSFNGIYYLMVKLEDDYYLHKIIVQN